MLTDPQSVTIAGTAIPLPRVASQDRTSTYQSADGNLTMIVSTPRGKRNRAVVRVNHRKVAADPFVSGNSRVVSMTFTVTVDLPGDGSYTVADAKTVWDAFDAALAASSGALKTKILSGEN